MRIEEGGCLKVSPGYMCISFDFSCSLSFIDDRKHLCSVMRSMIDSSVRENLRSRHLHASLNHGEAGEPLLGRPGPSEGGLSYYS